MLVRMKIDFLHPTLIRFLISFFLSFKSSQSFFIKLALIFLIVFASVFNPSVFNHRQINHLVLIVTAIIALILVKLPTAIRA